jgi:hypothetical protein
MEYSNENSGALFKNDKATKENSPAYTGKINVDGTDYRLAAWIKEGKSGKFMSLKVSELNTESKPVAKSSKIEDMDSDLPF